MKGRLTAAMVRATREPGLYGDGGTMYLRVGPEGSKSWIQRIMVNGKRRDIGLSGFSVVTLQEARELAIDNRRRVFRRVDPLPGRRKAKVDLSP